MKKTIKLIVCVFCMLMPQFGMAQSKWDAATCIDICTILAEQGSVTDNVLVRVTCSPSPHITGMGILIRCITGTGNLMR